MPYYASRMPLDEYREWAAKEMGWDLGPSGRTYYETVARRMKEQVAGSRLWARFCDRYRGIAEKYYSERGGHFLFQAPSPPEWSIKTFESLVEKSFRINRLQNEVFPREPAGGWVCPDTWFERVGDVVRTRVVVRYLDGPEYLGDALREIAQELAQGISMEFKCREDGYYAAHVDIRYDLEIPRRNWDTQRLDCSCEVQITTQLQELVQGLMHRYYEEQRASGHEGKESMPWQWRFREAEFSASYLGHVLHYLEGMIMGVRDKIGEVTHERLP